MCYFDKRYTELFSENKFGHILLKMTVETYQDEFFMCMLASGFLQKSKTVFFKTFTLQVLLTCYFITCFKNILATICIRTMNKH